ncbi:MAG: hypothetical protein ACP5E4_02780 [Candidatus Aenigmatarchaeota archaeon]
MRKAIVEGVENARYHHKYSADGWSQFGAAANFLYDHAMASNHPDDGLENDLNQTIMGEDGRKFIEGVIKSQKYYNPRAKVRNDLGALSNALEVLIYADSLGIEPTEVYPSICEDATVCLKRSIKKVRETPKGSTFDIAKHTSSRLSIIENLADVYERCVIEAFIDKGSEHDS